MENNKNNSKSITELEQLKKDLRNHIENLDDFIVSAYHKDLKKFFILIERLNNTNLNLLTKKEVKALAFINRINKFDIEFMKREL